MSEVFFAVAISGIIAQSVKIIANLRDARGFHIADLVTTGGMPSTHSALVSSLLMITFLSEGVTSVSVLALVLFIVVVTDSLGVRRSVGEEGKTLNKIIKMEKLHIHQFHYSLGHKPIEVAVGVLLGFVLSYLIYIL